MMTDVLNKLDALESNVTCPERMYLQVHKFEGDRAEEGVFEEYLAEYQELVDQLEKHWERPAFEVTWESPDFPEWPHWVARLAVWERSGRYVYLELVQQDNELPIWIVAGTHSK